MSAFDRIIGYTSIKNELTRIADTLRDGEVYSRLGVHPAKGLLLYGEPGVGKSLMASAVIEESGRKTFTCRKDRPNGDFIKEIKATFDRAGADAPSIVYLDDLDKFANGDERHPDAEEYVTVQSCIDEVKEKDVFVLATANNIRCLPGSLRRAGRFDRKIEVKAPRGEDAKKIITYYLNGKKCVGEMDIGVIARIMGGRSCAELESVINEAGLIAGYERSDKINMDHFMRACLSTVYEVATGGRGDDEDDYEDDDSDGKSDSCEPLENVIYHEVGHAVVSEVLCPGSVTLISAHGGDEGHVGFTAYYNDRTATPLYWTKSRIAASLGGAAAEEYIYGQYGLGCDEDFNKAFSDTADLVESSCLYGFHLYNSRYSVSEHLKELQEQTIAGEVEKFYRKAKEIIIYNGEFFAKIAEELRRKRLLSVTDIARIRSACAITQVSLD